MKEYKAEIHSSIYIPIIPYTYTAFRTVARAREREFSKTSDYVRVADIIPKITGNYAPEIPKAVLCTWKKEEEKKRQSGIHARRLAKAKTPGD